MPPGTSSPSRIVPPIEKSLDPPWPPETPVPSICSSFWNHHIVTGPSAVQCVYGCPWINVFPSASRLARVENSLEAYSTASPFSEERRTPSFGSPSAHFWTTYVTFTETQPGGAGTNVRTTPLLWGKPGVAKLFQVTVDSLQLSQVW